VPWLRARNSILLAVSMCSIIIILTRPSLNLLEVSSLSASYGRSEAGLIIRMYCTKPIMTPLHLPFRQCSRALIPINYFLKTSSKPLDCVVPENGSQLAMRLAKSHGHTF
jgi:hypothetical protein